MSQPESSWWSNSAVIGPLLVAVVTTLGVIMVALIENDDDKGDDMGMTPSPTLIAQANLTPSPAATSTPNTPTPTLTFTPTVTPTPIPTVEDVVWNGTTGFDDWQENPSWVVEGPFIQRSVAGNTSLYSPLPLTPGYQQRASVRLAALPAGEIQYEYIAGLQLTDVSQSTTYYLGIRIRPTGQPNVFEIFRYQNGGYVTEQQVAISIPFTDGQLGIGLLFNGESVSLWDGRAYVLEVGVVSGFVPHRVGVYSSVIGSQIITFAQSHSSALASPVLGHPVRLVRREPVDQTALGAL